jgi:transposase-like protein
MVRLVSLSKAVSGRQFTILRMQYREGVPIKDICLRLKISRDTLERERDRALRRLESLPPLGVIIDFDPPH